MQLGFIVTRLDEDQDKNRLLIGLVFEENKKKMDDFVREEPLLNSGLRTPLRNSCW